MEHTPTAIIGIAKIGNVTILVLTEDQVPVRPSHKSSI